MRVQFNTQVFQSLFWYHLGVLDTKGNAPPFPKALQQHRLRLFSIARSSANATCLTSVARSNVITSPYNIPQVQSKDRSLWNSCVISMALFLPIFIRLLFKQLLTMFIKQCNGEKIPKPKISTSLLRFFGFLCFVLIAVGKKCEMKMLENM